MAKAPEYGPRKQTLRPVFTGKMDSRASPAAFGAQTGQGLGHLASGMDRLGNAVQLVREMEDKAVVEKQVNSYSDYARTSTYDPETGYTSRLGINAVTSYQTFVDDLESKRVDLGKNLTPARQKSYNNATHARQRQALNTGIKHAAVQKSQWFDNSSNARLTTFADDALAMFNEPEKLEVNLAAGQKEIANMGVLKGWSPEQTSTMQKEFTSGVHNNIILKLATTAPIKAKDWLDAHRGDMTQESQIKLDKALDLPVLQERASSNAKTILGKNLTGDGGVGKAMVMVSGFEGYRDIAYYDVNHHRVGYGSDTRTDEQGRVFKTRKGDVVTQKEAERDLSRRIIAANKRLENEFGSEIWQALSPEAQGALLSVDYNYGELPHGVKVAVRTGDKNRIADAVFALSGHNKGINADRRTKEAKAIRYGIMIFDPSSFGNMTGGITDLRLRQATQIAIVNQLTMEDRLAKLQKQKAQQLAEQWMIKNPDVSPTLLPLEIQKILGVASMKKLDDYHKQMVTTGDIETKEEAYFYLQKMAVTDPDAFSKMNLFDYKEYLSKQDMRKLEADKNNILKDKRKAIEDSRSVAQGMKIAELRLQEFGIKKKESEANGESRLKIVQFENALKARIQEFINIKTNKTQRSPNNSELEGIITQLLLPVIIKSPGFFWGSGSNAWMFEARLRADVDTVETSMPYENIPIDIRRVISDELHTELGREPTKEEVSKEYTEQFVPGTRDENSDG